MDKHFIAKIHDETPYLYIGQVAELTGASRKAIRHYESLGLIPEPKRRGIYRIYSERDVFLVHMIKTAQGVGFTLNELRDLVAEKVKKRLFPLEFANRLFERKKAQLEQRIKSIRQQLTELDELHAEMKRIFR